MGLELGDRTRGERGVERVGSAVDWTVDRAAAVAKRTITINKDDPVPSPVPPVRSNVKTHLVDRRTRLKNSSYKPGLKVLGEKLTP